MKFSALRSLNRFFLSQALYPLLLSSALALSLYAGRIVLSRSWTAHGYLIWNIYLAWIPYLCSVLAAAVQRLYPRRWWLLLLPGGLWLAFFPNAPYIMTDFLHLYDYSNAPIWYDILMLASFAWTGIFLAIVSLRTMHNLIQRYLGGIVGWTFVGIAIAMSGLGIYLGRFERWNSWDLLFNPRGIMKDIAMRLVNPFENLRFFGFTLGFTIFLLVCYLTFISVRKMDEAASR